MAAGAWENICFPALIVSSEALFHNGFSILPALLTGSHSLVNVNTFSKYQP
jgi:hypothetical protein